jgi:DNA-binding MarR family transcriptional regulator
MVKAKTNASIDIDFRTWWLIHQSRDVIFRIRNRELSQYGVTTEQAAILFIIKNFTNLKKKSTPGEISKWTLREPHSVSKILTRMEKIGFVKKTSGLGKKKNEVHISLTEKGEQAYNYSLNRNSIQKVMSIFSEEECLQLNALLMKLRDKGLQDLTKKVKAVFP